MRRYAHLRTAGFGMMDDESAQDLNQAEETDTPEIEALRDVAYKDALAIARSDAVVALNWRTNLLKTMA